MTCREHDWKPDMMHARDEGDRYVAERLSYICRKCGEWRDGPWDAAAWKEHYEDVMERMRWDALLLAPAATA